MAALSYALDAVGVDLEQDGDAILPHTEVRTAALPYITGEFMPRKISDRPQVIPDGCVNLAFLGQYVEQPRDVVFTAETSLRTAIMPCGV